MSNMHSELYIQYIYIYIYIYALIFFTDLGMWLYQAFGEE